MEHWGFGLKSLRFGALVGFMVRLLRANPISVDIII
jgi:hypothetical protein